MADVKQGHGDGSQQLLKYILPLAFGGFFCPVCLESDPKDIKAFLNMYESSCITM